MQLNAVKQIWILDSFTETPLGVLDNQASSGNSFEAIEHRQLNGYSTLDLTLYATSNTHAQIKEENKLAYVDPYGSWKVFNIKRFEVKHTGDNNVILTVYAEESAIELLDNVSTVNIKQGEVLTAEQFINRAVAGTRWTVGSVPTTSALTVENEQYFTSNMQMLVYGAELYQLDLSFDYIPTGNTIVQYIVNYTEYTPFSGRRFAYGSDIEEVTRTADTTDLKTAVIAFGGNLNAEVENAPIEYLTLNGLTLTPGQTYQMVTPDGDTTNWTIPANLRTNGYMIYDATAQAVWGYDSGNIFREVKYNNDKVLDQVYLAYISWAYLQALTSPRITYEVAAYNMGALAWVDTTVDYKRVKIGDTVGIIDKLIGLEVYTRVIQMDLDLCNVVNSTFTFGMFYQTLSDLYLGENVYQNQIDSLKDQVDNLEGQVGQLPDGVNQYNYIRNGKFMDGLAEWNSTNFNTSSFQTNVYGPAEAFPINQEDDPIITQTDYDIYAFGDWTESPNANTTTEVQLEAQLTSSYLLFNFTGNNVSFLATKVSGGGSVEVFLDGVSQGSVSLSSGSTQYKQNVFSRTGLSDTAHTLKVVITTNEQPVIFDSFKVNYFITTVANRVDIEDQLGEYLVDDDAIFEYAMEISGGSSNVRTLYQDINRPNAYLARTVTFSAYFNYSNLSGSANLVIAMDYRTQGGTSSIEYTKALPTGSPTGWNREYLAQTLLPANISEITKLTCKLVLGAGASINYLYATGFQLELGSKPSTWKPYQSDLIGSGIWDRIQAIKQQQFRELLGYTYVSESNGIWVYDSPTGPGKAVVIKGGTIGLGKFDSYSQSWDFKTFVDGQSVNADAINTGQMLADRIYGGVLRLGNIQGRAGYLEVVSEDGTPVIILSADASQYRQNQVTANFVFGVDPTLRSINWYGKPPQNIVGKSTTDITPNQGSSTTVNYYVSMSGNDANSGASYNTSLRTIQEALNRLPEFLQHIVNIYVARGLNYEGFKISGFSGGSADPDITAVNLYIRGEKPPKTRYVRVWIYANPDGTYSNGVNANVQMYEMQVFEKNYNTNVALGKTITLKSGGFFVGTLDLLTNGETYLTDTSGYVVFNVPTTSTPLSFTLDLGQEYDISGVKLFFYWAENESVTRSYPNIVIQANNSNVDANYTIVDQRSTAVGTPFYLPTGPSDQFGYYYPTIPMIVGNNLVTNNNLVVGIYDLMFRTTTATQPMRAFDCFATRFFSCIFDAGRVSLNACRISVIAQAYFSSCEFSNVIPASINKDSRLFFASQSTAVTYNCQGANTGGEADYAVGYDATIGQSFGAVPYGTNLLSSVNASITTNWPTSGRKGTVSDTSKFGTPAPPPPPPPPPVTTATKTYSSIGSAQWRHDSKKWNTQESNPAQGTWGYGLRSGYWWFGANIYNLVNGGATIKSMKFTFTRNGDNNGLGGAANCTVRTHNYENKPTTPAFSNSDPSVTTTIGRGETKTITLSQAMIDKFNAKQARGIYIYNTSTAQSYYLKCNGSAKLEVTYEQ